MNPTTQKNTPKEKVTPKVAPRVRLPNSNLWVDVETGQVYVDPATLKVLTQGAL